MYDNGPEHTRFNRDYIFPVARQAPLGYASDETGLEHSLTGQWVWVEHASTADTQRKQGEVQKAPSKARLIEESDRVSSGSRAEQGRIGNLSSSRSLQVREVETDTAATEQGGFNVEFMADPQQADRFLEREPVFNWDTYDGGVGDGERPGGSRQIVAPQVIGAGRATFPQHTEERNAGAQLRSLPKRKSAPAVGAGRGAGTTNSVQSLQVQDEDVDSGLQKENLERISQEELRRRAEQLPKGDIRGLNPAKKQIWIVGHSFVKWAAIFADHQIYGRNLGIPGAGHELYWCDKGGMRWENLFPLLAKIRYDRGGPDMLILHLGENDLVALSGLSIIKAMQLDLAVVSNNWLGTSLVWTEFVFRQQWKNARSQAAMEKARKKVNRAMKIFCVGLGIQTIAHDSITGKEGHLFREDGVHLTQFGMAYYILEIRAMLSKILKVDLWVSSRREE
ncbi:uncharacterized protein LOC144762002 [Lissotriton helveticus]